MATLSLYYNIYHDVVGALMQGLGTWSTFQSVPVISADVPCTYTLIDIYLNLITFILLHLPAHLPQSEISSIVHIRIFFVSPSLLKNDGNTEIGTADLPVQVDDLKKDYALDRWATWTP